MNKTTLTIVAYDISCDKRRTKVHKLLSGFGTWTQFSLFECFLTEKQWVDLLYRLQALIVPNEDCIRVYRLCTTCTDRVETFGQARPADDVLFLV